jgi:hypothetical protein
LAAVTAHSRPLVVKKKKKKTSKATERRCQEAGLQNARAAQENVSVEAVAQALRRMLRSPCFYICGFHDHPLLNEEMTFF